MLLLAGMAGGSPAPYDWTPPICRFAWGSLQALPTPPQAGLGEFAAGWSMAAGLLGQIYMMLETKAAVG